MKQTLRYINILVFALFILTYLGCRNGPVDPVIIVSIDDEFEIDLWENLANDASSLSLKINTIAPVECEQTEIDYNINDSAIGKITIALNGIVPPNDCVTAAVPAESNANIGYLNKGSFDFEINLEGTTVINEGNLKVTTESYVLRMNTSNGFRLLHETLLRVPYQTVWGAVHFQNLPQTLNAAHRFLNEVKDLSTEKDYEEGYYGHFTIDDNKEIVTDYMTSFPNSIPFIFDYKNNVNTLEGIIQQYREDYGENLEIQMYTWDGKQL